MTTKTDLDYAKLRNAVRRSLKRCYQGADLDDATQDATLLLLDYLECGVEPGLAVWRAARRINARRKAIPDQCEAGERWEQADYAGSLHYVTKYAPPTQFDEAWELDENGIPLFRYFVTREQ